MARNPLFHTELSKALKTSGHTVEYLAKLTGRSCSSVYKWLNGTATPNSIILKQLGKELCDNSFAFMQPDMIYPNGTYRM